MNAPEDIPQFHESTNVFVLTIGELIDEVRNQRFLLLTARNENERLQQQLAEIHVNNTDLQSQLDARTESQTLEITEQQNRIAELEFTNNNLMAENSELQAKMRILSKAVVDLQNNVEQRETKEENLLFENQKLKTDLTNRDAEMKTLTAQTQAQANKIRAKETLISDLTNKRIDLQKANDNLTLKLSTTENRLSLIEPAYIRSNEQLQTLQRNHAEQIIKCQTLEQQCQNQRIELNHYKRHKMVVEVFELHRILENVKSTIVSVHNQLSTKRNSEERATTKCAINQMESEYEEIERNLESHGRSMPQLDFADTVNTYTEIHNEINAKFKEGLDRLAGIDREAVLIWNAVKDVMYKIIEIVKSSGERYIREMGHLASITLTEELATEQQLFQQVKNLYRQIRAYEQTSQQ